MVFVKRAVLRDRIKELEQDAEAPTVTWDAVLNKPTTFPAADLGQPGGPAQLDGTGKLSADELPPLEHDSAEAATEAAMLALSVTAPAICIRTDFTPAHVFYLSADPASTLANWHDTGAFSSAAAAPTATVGPAATNGVAATYMRSDAAPALDLTATYTWTGVHTFTQSIHMSEQKIVNVGDPADARDAVNLQYLDSVLPSNANPTAQVGPTVVNGVASTFMRSDAAPAINLTAGYAWTGVHAFSASPTVPVPSNGTEVANKNYVDAQIIAGTTGFVDLTTAQTIAGVKTFSASPVVPAPTTDTHAATKAYVDGAASSGTYTPTLTAVINNTAPAALGAWMYSQTGKKIDVSGTLTITASASGDVEVGISLPVTLDITSSFQVAGFAAGLASGTTADCYGLVSGTAGTDTAMLFMTIPDTSERYVTVQFSYVLP